MNLTGVILVHGERSTFATAVHHVVFWRTMPCVRGSACPQRTHAVTTVNTTLWQRLLAFYRNSGAGRETEEIPPRQVGCDSIVSHWIKLINFPTDLKVVPVKCPISSPPGAGTNYPKPQ